MSRDMFTSCGIQWLAQVARYFSHAHLYLNGTSWLTSVAPLMIRLSDALTRRALGAAGAAGEACRCDEMAAASALTEGAASDDGKAETARGAVLAA